MTLVVVKKQKTNNNIKSQEQIMDHFIIVLLELFIVLILISAFIFIFCKTVFFMLNSYNKAKTIYELYKEGKLNEIKKLKCNKKQSNYIVTSIFIVLGAALLFMILVYVAHKYFGLHISSDHVVITFVGIIATFIVVTNYAQVSDIKKDIEDRISNLDKRMKYFSKKIEQEKNIDKNQ